MKFYFVNSFAQQTLIMLIKKTNSNNNLQYSQIIILPYKKTIDKKIKIRLLNRCPMPHVWLKK